MICISILSFAGCISEHENVSVPTYPQISDVASCEESSIGVMSQDESFCNIPSVSYTHLDVYKRQACPPPSGQRTRSGTEDTTMTPKRDGIISIRGIMTRTSVGSSARTMQICYLLHQGH